jgi:hypothetical protein
MLKINLCFKFDCHGGIETTKENPQPFSFHHKGYRKSMRDKVD